MILPIYLLFTFSGFIGLVYESLFARYLKLFLGHSSYGQLLTMCIYMGGLGIGSIIGGALAQRSRRPLLLYAGIELAAGIGGCLYHAIFVLSTDAFFTASMPPAARPLGVVAVKVALAAALTSPLAILLGMTFPCLAVALMRMTGDKGALSLPRLYFTNSLGAAAGIMAASYFLIPLWGTAGSLRAAACGNLLIAAAFGLMDRRVLRASSSAPITRPPSFQTRRGPHTLFGSGVAFWLMLSAATGFSSFVYEIGWIRLLSLVLGSATHSFDIMVSAFILGLACGGLFSQRLLRRPGAIPAALGIIQIAMGCCAIATVYVYKPFFLIMNRSHGWFTHDELGFGCYTLFKYLLCLILMFPACFFAGMTLPMITRFLTGMTGDESHTGTVYGANTLGAILGAAIGGLALLPLVQLKMTIAIGAFIDLLLGALLIWRFWPRPWAPVLATALCVTVAAPVFFVNFNRHIIAAGMYRHRVGFARYDSIMVRDGATATVSFQILDSLRTLKCNGKPDASLNPYVNGEREDDEYTQAGLAFIPMSFFDRPYSAALIGLGSGLTAHHLLADPLITKLDIVEIEKEVRRAARGFLPYNERAFHDPRVFFTVDDAKTFFHVKRSTYDLIISQPSNPWVSGVASLFTREFYAHVSRFLNSGGMLMQWMHLYEFDSNLLLSIVKAMEEVFSSIHIFGIPKENDIMLVAWKDQGRPMRCGRFASTPSIRADFDRMEIPADFFGPQNYLVSASSLKPLLAHVQPNSDYLPMVDNAAEKAFFKKTRVELFDAFEENCVFYQEILEPETFPEVARIIREKRAQQPPDAAAIRAAAATLRAASLEADWERIDSIFYDAVYDWAGTSVWDTLEAVRIYRELVRQKIPPNFMQLRFKLIDAASQRLHAETAQIVNEMIQDYPIDEASATLLRVVAIEALRTGDATLCRKAFDKFIKNNKRFDKYEYLMLQELMAQ